MLNTEQLAECGQMVAQYEAALQPASPVVVAEKLLEAALIYPDRQTSEKQAEGRTMVYAKQLSDLPADILVKAFDRTFCELKFFPTVAEIRERAEPDMTRRRAKLHRLMWTASENRAREAERAAAEQRALERQVSPAAVRRTINGAASAMKVH